MTAETVRAAKATPTTYQGRHIFATPDARIDANSYLTMKIATPIDESISF